METTLTKHDVEVIRAVVDEVNKNPQPLSINEKLLTAAITLIGLFAVGVVISGLSWLITYMWRNILH